MFPATELNLQEAGGPERQCDHLPVREQGDIKVLWVFAETLQEPFFWVWEANLVGGLQAVYPPPLQPRPLPPPGEQ